MDAPTFICRDCGKQQAECFNHQPQDCPTPGDCDHGAQCFPCVRDNVMAILKDVTSVTIIGDSESPESEV